MFPSYRNQSVDLQSRSTDWFLYDGNIGRKRVNASGMFAVQEILEIIIRIENRMTTVPIEQEEQQKYWTEPYNIRNDLNAKCLVKNLLPKNDADCNDNNNSSNNDNKILSDNWISQLTRISNE